MFRRTRSTTLTPGAPSGNGRRDRLRSAGVHPSVPRTRSVPEWLRGTAAIGALAGVGVFAAAVTVYDSVSVFLPPDAAHFIADADAMVGGGVRGLRHPPVFPALVLLFKTVMPDIAAVQVALFASLAIFIVSLYHLMRRWYGPRVSLAAAAGGAFLPIVATLFAFGVGATLIGLAMLALALAAFERWVAEPTPRRAVTTALLLALTALSHLLAFMAAAICLGIRGLLLLRERRGLDGGWGPLGARGIGVCAIAVGIAVGLTMPLYLGGVGSGSFGVRLPVLTDAWRYLGHALSGDPFINLNDVRLAPLWLLFSAGVVASVLFSPRPVLIYMGSLGAFYVLSTTTLGSHPSYIARPTHLVPVAMAFAMAALFQWMAPWVDRMASRTERRRLVISAGLTAFVAFLILISFTSVIRGLGGIIQLIDPEDVRALEALAHGRGAVATSWNGADYGDGVSKTWFVEGLSKRPAYGLSDPWVGLFPEQRRAGAVVGKLFAGTHGVGNGSLQVVGGQEGMRADPAIWVRLEEDYFVPALFANSETNHLSYFGPSDSSLSPIPGGLQWRYSDRSGTEVAVETATLSGRRVRLIYERVGGNPGNGSWTIRFYPAPGGSFTDVAEGARALDMVAMTDGRRVPVRVTSPTATIVYWTATGARAEQLNVTAKGSTVQLDFYFPRAKEPSERLTAFSESEILSRHDITNVVVWKDSQWRRRFDLSPCFELARNASRLLIYDADASGCDV